MNYPKMDDVDYRYRLQWAMNVSKISEGLLARSLGASEQTVRCYLRGSMVPNDGMKMRIARVLHMDEEWMVTGIQPFEWPDLPTLSERYVFAYKRSRITGSDFYNAEVGCGTVQNIRNNVYPVKKETKQKVADVLKCPVEWLFKADLVQEDKVIEKTEKAAQNERKPPVERKEEPKMENKEEPKQKSGNKISLCGEYTMQQLTAMLGMFKDVVYKVNMEIEVV